MNNNDINNEDYIYYDEDVSDIDSYSDQYYNFDGNQTQNQDNYTYFDEYSYIDKNSSLQQYSNEDFKNETSNVICIFSAFCGIFALFLLFIEKQNKKIRITSMQSAVLLIFEIIIVLVLWMVGLFFSVIPVLKYIVSAIIWLIFIAWLVIDVFLRFNMMKAAYNGKIFKLPFLNKIISKFV